MAKAPPGECDTPHPFQGAARRVPSPASIDRAANLFRALGESSRLRLLSRLIDGHRCVGELAEAEKEAMSTISQRLRVLRAENIVVRHRRGKHVLYSLVDRHVTELVLNALAHADEIPEIEPKQDQ